MISTRAPAPALPPSPLLSSAARRERRRAWWCLAALPLGFVAATLVGGALLAWQGYDAAGEHVPLVPAMLAALPALLLLLAPPLGTVWFGLRARRLGDPADDHVTVGLSVAAVLLVLNVVPTLVGR